MIAKSHIIAASAMCKYLLLHTFVLLNEPFDLHFDLCFKFISITIIEKIHLYRYVVFVPNYYTDVLTYVHSKRSTNVVQSKRE